MSNETVDRPRRRDDRAGLGQVFTPQPIAKLLASKFDFSGLDALRVLDPGAGLGALSEALLVRLRQFSRVGTLTMVETDALLAGHLEEVVQDWPANLMSVTVVHKDFVQFALEGGADSEYSHIVMNPPYMRIGAQAATRKTLSAGGVHVSNMYAAFLWLGLDLLASGGQLVAIVPRSFFNGPQFRALRQRIVMDCRLVSIHSFDKRSVFRRDGVLQETVIVRIDKAKSRSTIRIETSASDGSGTEVLAKVPTTAVMHPDDPDFRFRIPLGLGRTLPRAYKSIFGENVQVRTGSVVDFRQTQDITTSPSSEAVPLIGSEEFLSSNARPPRYLRVNDRTAAHVYPVGNYVVVKRVSPREQVPRLRAALVDASRLSKYEGVAFENHVNVIHSNGEGLPMDTALSVLASIQSAEAQTQFTELSGTTQVNVSDLYALRFPVS